MLSVDVDPSFPMCEFSRIKFVVSTIGLWVIEKLKVTTYLQRVAGGALDFALEDSIDSEASLRAELYRLSPSK